MMWRTAVIIIIVLVYCGMDWDDRRGVRRSVSMWQTAVIITAVREHETVLIHCGMDCDYCRDCGERRFSLLPCENRIVRGSGCVWR